MTQTLWTASEEAFLTLARDTALPPETLLLVNAGQYKAVITFDKSNSDSVIITVKDDPTAPIDYAIRDAKRKYANRIDNSNLKLIDLNERLSDAEEVIKKAINEFKLDNPDFLVPKTTIKNQGSYDLIDEQLKEPSYWYSFYFYYKNENKILLTLVRSVSQGKSLIAFVSINAGLDLGHWKDINKDFSSSEDKQEKKIFEERILNRLKEKLNKK